MNISLEVNPVSNPKNIEIKSDIFNDFQDAQAKSSSYFKIEGNLITINDSFFSQKTKVQDYIRIINPNIKFKKNDVSFNTKISDGYLESGKYIVLILESPHKDEYEKVITEPRYPANGSSGRLINQHFKNIIRNGKNIIRNDKDVSEIIISNPIQWQTSLYYLHKQSLSGKKNESYKTLRNEVWKKIWEKQEVKDNFNNRIERYKPKIIINACTSELKEEIRYFLRNNFNNDILYEINHPASWGCNDKNRELKKSI